MTSPQPTHLRQHVHKALLVHRKVQLARDAPHYDVAHHPARSSGGSMPCTYIMYVHGMHIHHVCA
jgi:hypothetical protein